jgi:hypothetical protein
MGPRARRPLSRPSRRLARRQRNGAPARRATSLRATLAIFGSATPQSGAKGRCRAAAAVRSPCPARRRAGRPSSRYVHARASTTPPSASRRLRPPRGRRARDATRRYD